MAALPKAVNEAKETREIDCEIRNLHNRLETLNSGIVQLVDRLDVVMSEEAQSEGRETPAPGPQTKLGSCIRLAADRVESHIALVSSVLRRLELP